MNDFKYICIQIFPVFLKFEIYTAVPLTIITFSNKKRGSVVGVVSVFVSGDFPVLRETMCASLSFLQSVFVVPLSRLSQSGGVCTLMLGSLPDRVFGLAL